MAMTYDPTVAPELEETADPEDDYARQERILAVQQRIDERYAQVLQQPMMDVIADAALHQLVERTAGQAGGHRAPANMAAQVVGTGTVTGLAPGTTFHDAIAPVLADPDQLPTVPVAYHRLSNLLNNSGATAKQVADIVGSDPVSASGLLRLANSSFYGMRNKVTTVTAGVKLLGFETVRTLVLAITAEAMFSDVSREVAAASEQLWYHSIACGVGSRVIARHLGARDPEQYFVAGLLHDLGKIVLFRCTPEVLKTTLATVARKDVLFVEAENEVCGTNHGELGALLGRQWGFPENLTEAMSLHHQPELGKANPQLVAAVHVANVLSQALEIGSSGNSRMPAVSPAALQLLNLDTAKLRSIAADLESEYPAVEAMLTTR